MLVCLSIALLAFRTHATSIEVSGEVSGQWNVDTVKVTSDIFLPGDQTLTIDPGVRVEFMGHFQFTVRGSVIALGLPDEMIEFTRSDTTGFSDTLTGAGGWNGIFYEHLDPSVDSSLFSHCRFRFGKAITMVDSIGLYGGAFRVVEFSKIAFFHCVFEYNHAYRWGGAIYGRQASVRIKDCVFRYNESGRSDPPWGYGGAVCFVYSSPEIVSNLFEQNSSTGIGGGASFEYSDPLVTHNIFSGNFSGLGGGLGYLRSEPQQVCSNNLVVDNEARFFGGGIACVAAHTVFVNNTVTNNVAVYGGGYYCNDSAVPSNYNCLFYNNFAYEGMEIYIWDIRSAPNFYFCNVPGDTSGFAGSGGHEGYHGEYLNNLDTLVEFSGTGSYPFQLGASSPMKDAGTPDTSSLMVPGRDLAGNPRIYNNRLDIGAYEWNPGLGIASNERQGIDVTLFPVPAFENLTIRFTLNNAHKVGFSVYRMSGELVYRHTPVDCSTGTNEICWDLKDHEQNRLSAGCYVLQLHGNHLSNGVLFYLTDEK